MIGIYIIFYPRSPSSEPHRYVDLLPHALADNAAFGDLCGSGGPCIPIVCNQTVINIETKADRP